MGRYRHARGPQTGAATGARKSAADGRVIGVRLSPPAAVAPVSGGFPGSSCVPFAGVVEMVFGLRNGRVRPSLCGVARTFPSCC